MEKPTVLLFDIDNTLLDFSAGAMQAMEEIFREAGLPYAPEMFAVFQVENDKLWARIERGELTIAGLRDVRWQTILTRLGLEADGAAMEDAFRVRLHESAVPVAGALDVLTRLHGKYRLCTASNGPYAQQVNRLRRAGMLDAFERLFISGQLGAEKPSRVFFDRCLAQLTGFHLTRGMLCAMRRPALPEVAALCANAARVAVLENVMNPTNIGAIFRSAAALGVDAVLLTSAGSDPLYRRAVRVSMGTVFQVPWTYLPADADWQETLHALGFQTAAMALRDDSLRIDDKRLRAVPRLAIVLGTEGDGLASNTIAACDYTVRIPMTHGVDSLNVAAASAVAFYQLALLRGRDT